MSVFSACCSGFAALSKAAAKSAAAKVRQFRLAPVRVDWAARATVCERCPLRVISKNVSYCGKPFLKQIHRDETLDGCGCPVRAKSQDPAEHCPITRRHLAATQSATGCDCKWCRINAPV